MPEMTKYQEGVPSWADLGTHDLGGAAAFYRGLFGWNLDDQGEEAGHYTIASKDGKQVAAISPVQSDPGPPHWTTYIDVDDADLTTRKIESAGGKVLAGPMDVMEAGRLAVFADPTGAVFAIWQPGRHIGAQLVNEPGAMVWNELNSSDLDRARAFYSEVFGWSWENSENYAEFRVDGRTVGGAMPRPPELPAEVPDHWLVYFASADLDGDLEKAAALGGTTVFGPQEIPGTGRFAIVTDPAGAAFGLFAT